VLYGRNRGKKQKPDKCFRRFAIGSLRVLTRQTSERPKSYYRDWGLRAQDNVAFQFFVYE
jgi:hypothetical protein